MICLNVLPSISVSKIILLYLSSSSFTLFNQTPRFLPLVENPKANRSPEGVIVILHEF